MLLVNPCGQPANCTIDSNVFFGGEFLPVADKKKGWPI
jgi:hypothetical protein